MKRIAILTLFLFCATLTALAQDRALEQRLNELSGRIEILLEGQENLRKQMAELQREIDTLREHQNKPVTPSATQADLNRLADSVREIDRKRLDDYEKIRSELMKLGKTLASSAPVRATPPAREPAKEAAPEKGFNYTVQPGDTISSIVDAYRENKIKVTVDQVLKANPGLKPERLRAGQTLFIPDGR